MMRVGERQQLWLVHLLTRNVHLAELWGTRGFEWLQEWRRPLGTRNYAPEHVPKDPETSLLRRTAKLSAYTD